MNAFLKSMRLLMILTFLLAPVCAISIFLQTEFGFSLAHSQSLPRSDYYIIAASRSALPEAEAIAAEIRGVIPSTTIMQSANGQYAVVVGPFPNSKVREQLAAWVNGGTLPNDSFLSTGRGYTRINAGQPEDPPALGAKVVIRENVLFLDLASGVRYRVMEFDNFRRLSPGSLVGAIAGRRDHALPSGTRIAIPVRFMSCRGFRVAADNVVPRASETKGHNFSELGDMMFPPDVIVDLRISNSFVQADVEKEAKRCEAASESWLSRGAPIFIAFLRAQLHEKYNRFVLEKTLFSYSYETYGKYGFGAWTNDFIGLGPSKIGDHRYLDRFR